MSKLETPMTLAYGEQIGGTLIEEFRVVDGSPTCGRRHVDAIIVRGAERRRVPPSQRRAFSLKGQDVIVVQAKAKRLGMYLLGQAIFSARLIQAFGPASVRTVALCIEDDSVLSPLAKDYGVEVVVMPHVP